MSSVLLTVSGCKVDSAFNGIGRHPANIGRGLIAKRFFELESAPEEIRALKVGRVG